MTTDEWPMDWDLVRLGDHFTITSSKRVFQSDWRLTGVPFYRARELAVLGERGRVDNKLFIERGMFDRYRRDYGAPSPGDFLVTGVGTLGKTYVVQDGDEFYFKDGNIIWFKASKSIDSDFLNQLYRTPFVRNQIFGSSGGSTVGTYTITNAKLTVIALPPREEQLAIADALRDADELIATLERLIAKKQSIKQGMMQQLLTGRTRLPGCNRPWFETTVYELANNHRTLFNDGDWIESEHITNIGNRLLQTGNIGIGRLLERGTKRYISDDSFSTLKCKEVVPGDILLCRLAEPAGRACIVVDIGERRMLTSVDVSIYRPDPRLADRRFLVAAFSTPEWFKEVGERCGGSTRTRIARSELGRIRISLPSLQEQKRIADVLDDVNTELDALDARLAKARVIKQGMMQQLLTGRTRLSVGAPR